MKESFAFLLKVLCQATNKSLVSNDLAEIFHDGIWTEHEKENMCDEHWFWNNKGNFVSYIFENLK